MKAVVRQNRRLTVDFRLLEVAWPDRLREPLPGQFVMVRADSSTDPLWRRPLGVHDYRGGKGGKGPSAFLLFQVVGPTTERLAGFEAGESIDLLGPFGRGFSGAGVEHWLVAGGRGIAPLYYFARTLKGHRRPFRVMVGGRSAAHVVRTGDLRRMGAPVEIATEDGSRGRTGLVTELLERSLRRLGDRRKKGIVLSACGPPGMLKSVARLARIHGVSARLSLDTLMACGQGYCQGCTIDTRHGYRLCCRDGPVFPAEDLKW